MEVRRPHQKNDTMMQDVAVVILNYNGRALLQQFLPSMVANSAGAEIYVIDNASTDDSLLFLKTNFPDVQIIVNDKNYGFADGYNVGLKNIKADIYYLLNSDVEVTENWLNPVLEIFENHPNTAVVQPKILDYFRKDYFEFAGAGGGFLDNLGYPFCRGRIFDKIEKDSGQYDDEAEIFWASGCAFFIRSKDFWEQKGFDGRFFAHMEEIDLCWRLINSGKKIMYTGKSSIYHAGGGTLAKQNPRKTFLNFRNNLSMLLKNLPASQIFPVIFLRLCLDGIAAVFLASKNGIPHLWAVARAHFAFYAEVPETLRRRGKFQTKNYYKEKWLVFKNFL